MSKKTEKIGVIKGTTKVALGHQPHVTGTGIQKDKRTKRNRTRAAKNRRAIKEYT